MPAMIDPSWWTSAVCEGRPLVEALARRDVAAVFRFLHARGCSYGAIGTLTELSPARIGEIAKGTRRVTAYDVLERIAVGLGIPRALMGLGRQPAAQQTFRPAEDRSVVAPGGLTEPGSRHADCPPAGTGMLLEQVRFALDEALASTTVSTRQLEFVEQSVAEHLAAYPATAPAVMLARLAIECVEVRNLSQRRQPAAIQARLSAAAALLTTMCADALMRLGAVDQARLWYRTAMIAADDSGQTRLRILVRAQAAMLPYYFGSPQGTVSLADEAIALSTTPCPSTALAAAARARALGKQGATAQSRDAATIARRLFDQVGEPDCDEAFRFPSKRLLLYLSGAATWIGDTTAAYRIQDEALEIYRHSAPSLVDPALIRLDQAKCLVTDRRLDEAATVTREAIEALSATQRTELVLTRADAVVAAIPRHERPEHVRDLTGYLRDCRQHARILTEGTAMLERQEHDVRRGADPPGTGGGVPATGPLC